MRIIAVLLSVVMLITLTYLFFIEEKTGQNTEKTSRVTELIIPAYISDTPLEVERVWQQLKADRIKAKQLVEDKTDKTLKNKDVLTLGENKYALYGIFNVHKKGAIEHDNTGHGGSSGQPFILIKALAKKEKSVEALMLKVMQGDELSKGVILVAVTSNSISFKQDDELIEFKLFEANK